MSIWVFSLEDIPIAGTNDNGRDAQMSENNVSKCRET